MSRPTEKLASSTPRWLHVWSVVTVVFALPLLTLGAEVTTKGVGMVDRAPVRSPLHLLQVIEESGGIEKVLEERGIGWLIEHSHRFVGWIVGLLTIGLAIGLLRFEPRRWMRAIGMAALAAVTLQGVLGMLRVGLQNRFGPEAGRNLALFHGCTAQLVFALLVAIAVWTSRSWSALASGPAFSDSAARTAALTLAGAVYFQIVLGAVLRHKPSGLVVRLHLLCAFAAVAAAIWAGIAVMGSAQVNSLARRSVMILWALLVGQLALGVETFLSRFIVSWSFTLERVEPLSWSTDLIRSLHVIVGALLFATSTVLVLATRAHPVLITRPEVASARRQLEGVL